MTSTKPNSADDVCAPITNRMRIAPSSASSRRGDPHSKRMKFELPGI